MYTIVYIHHYNITQNSFTLCCTCSSLSWCLQKPGNHCFALFSFFLLSFGLFSLYSFPLSGCPKVETTQYVAPWDCLFHLGSSMSLHHLTEHFFWLITFHCMKVPQFVNPFIYWLSLGYFEFGAIMNKGISTKRKCLMTRGMKSKQKSSPLPVHVAPEANRKWDLWAANHCWKDAADLNSYKVMQRHIFIIRGSKNV